MQRARVLTIAGSDPSGGAGLQADLKTFAAFGAYGMAAVAALTAQNTVGVTGVHAPPAAFLATQLDALVGDCPPAATKTGMLHSTEVIAVVAERAGVLGPLVVDPVLVATSGDRLLREDAEEAVRTLLVPAARVLTPNAIEAEVLTGVSVVDVSSACEAAAALLEMGAAAVLVKGGHVKGGDAVDVLVARGEEPVELRLPRLDLPAAHGTGCSLSAAIAAGLARGDGLLDAVQRAKAFVHAGLAAALAVGAGARPIDHGVSAPEGAW